MIRISAWSGRRWERDGEACRPPSPTAPGSQRGRPRGRKEAGNSLVVRSRSCWRRAPCESPAWCRRAPWSWWFSYSKWIWGSGVYRLYFPLFDPQVHGDCWRERREKINQSIRTRRGLSNSLKRFIVPQPSESKQKQIKRNYLAFGRVLFHFVAETSNSSSICFKRVPAGVGRKLAIFDFLV